MKYNIEIAELHKCTKDCAQMMEEVRDPYNENRYTQRVVQNPTYIDGKCDKCHVASHSYIYIENYNSNAWVTDPKLNQISIIKKNDEDDKAEKSDEELFNETLHKLDDVIFMIHKKDLKASLSLEKYELTKKFIDEIRVLKKNSEKKQDEKNVFGMLAALKDGTLNTIFDYRDFVKQYKEFCPELFTTYSEFYEKNKKKKREKTVVLKEKDDIVEEDPGMNYLLGNDELVISDTSYKMTIDYPLSKPYTVDFKSDRGFTRKEVVENIVNTYKYVYDEENKTINEQKVMSMDERLEKGGLINRNTTDGKFGIWGHDIGDLVIERLTYDTKTKQLSLFIGS